jgi:hypothetical protein
MKKLTISVLLVSLLAACASNKPAEVAAPAAASEAPAAAPVAEAAKEVAPATTDALDDATVFWQM